MIFLIVRLFGLVFLKRILFAVATAEFRMLNVLEVLKKVLVLITMDERRRNVHGEDIIVTYLKWPDTVSVKYIKSSEGDNGPFSLESLSAKLGLQKESSIMQFLKNNNLHKPGKGLRGAMLLINLCIGTVVKCVGTFILFHVWYPRESSGFKIIDLRKRDRYYGFYLQQIRGPPIFCTSSYGEGKRPYPYCIGGNVYMDPSGPHFCVPMTMSTVMSDNRAIYDQFLLNHDNLCSLTSSNQRTSSHVKHLRKSKKNNVLYVVDSESRNEMGKERDLFYIPVGILDEVECPWKKSDGSSGGM